MPSKHCPEVSNERDSTAFSVVAKLATDCAVNEVLPNATKLVITVDLAVLSKDCERRIEHVASANLESILEGCPIHCCGRRKKKTTRKKSFGFMLVE